MRMIQIFNIYGRKLYLLSNPALEPSASFTLCWDNDSGHPVQHRMTHLEVYAVLAGLLDEVRS